MSSDLGQYLEMLQSADPAQRRQAIIALGKSGDKRALSALKKVYKTDSDESLRQLALKAGRHLQKTTSAVDDDALSPIAPLAPLPSSDVVSADASSDVPAWMDQMAEAAKKPKKVTDRDKKRAKILAERAFDAQVHGNSEKVVDYIAEAIESDPALAKDGTLIGLLAQATGMDGMEAMQQLQQIAADDGKGKGKGRRKSSGILDWTETIDFAVEMGIWILVIAFIWAGILFGLVISLDEADWQELKDEAAADGATDQELEFYDSAEEYVDEYGDVFALIGGAVMSLSITATSVFMSLITWFVGVSFMGGEGLMYPFLRAMMRVTTVVLLIPLVATGISLFAAPGSGSSLGLILGFGPLVLGLVIIGWTIGRVHEFGTFMGCLNMIGTVIACSVMSCCCNLLSTV